MYCIILPHGIKHCNKNMEKVLLKKTAAEPE
jgi:hypothetical protein